MRRRAHRFAISVTLVAAGAVLAVSCVVPPSPRSDAAALERGPRVADSSIEYAPGLSGDVYKARSGGNRGVIILVHAGGFYSGSRSEVTLYTHSVMDQIERGFSVLSVDYRLSTGSTNLFPAALTDVSNAIRWVRDHGAENGLNPATVIVAGHSAGGTIAALIGLGANDPGSPRGQTPAVDGWIAISGFYDLRAGGLATLQRDVWLGAGANPDATNSASAVTLVDSADPPGYVVHGAKDPLVPLAQAVTLAARTLDVGRPAWLDIVSDPACDGHIPTCATNATFLNMWLDGLIRSD